MTHGSAPRRARSTFPGRAFPGIVLCLMGTSKTFQFGDFTTTVRQCVRSDLFLELPRERLCVADTNTTRIAAAEPDQFVLESGEASKSWSQLERILAELLERNLPRDGAVIGVGGGVVCDIAACAGSLFLRGCTVVLVPTSLLAMVDAALGGKTGINFGGYKNMVGTFYPAAEVRICTELLHTLPEHEFKSGLAEVIKSAMLGDTELFNTLELQRQSVMRREDDVLEEIVWRSIMVKGRIVEADLRETGSRAFLNLGHTFAHALESVDGLGRRSHGEAVAWGIGRALMLGVAIGLTKREYAHRVTELLAAYGYPLEIDADSSQLLAAMQRDKKRRDGAVRFVLQADAESTVLEPVPTDDVRQALERRAL